MVNTLQSTLYLHVVLDNTGGVFDWNDIVDN